VSRSTDQQKRIKAGPLEVALLDEIAGRLRHVEELMEAEVPKGAVEPSEKFTITDRRVSFRPLKPWFSISIINDGPSDVFCIVNTEKSFDEHRIASGETYNIDMKRAKVTDALMWCAKGHASAVRIVGVR
jgi:hypothetical protein